MWKKKSKKEKKKKFLNELETESYEQQIQEHNRQLARLQSRNDILEKEAESLKEKLKQLEESKADLTSHLQRVLKKKSEEARELQERVKALDKLLKDEEMAFKKKEDAMEAEFQKMNNNLTAELKLAAGKLIALEDARLNRIDLMHKFEDQERRMAEQEIRHKETLYETEKKLIIGKAKMQNELEKRLAELAESFRAATDLRLADATQRAVRENVSLHRELSSLLGYCRKLETKLQDYKENERNARLKASLYEAEARLALQQVGNQSRTIDTLMIDQKHMSHEIAMAHRAADYVRRGHRILEEAKQKSDDTRKKVRILQQNVEVTRDNRKKTIKAVQNGCRDIQRLSKKLTQVKEAVTLALEMQAEVVQKDGEEYDTCSICLLDVKDKLLESILRILETFEGSTANLFSETDETAEAVETLYEFGNLGLIPAVPEQSITSRTTTTDLPSSILHQPEGEKTLPSFISDCLCDE